MASGSPIPGSESRVLDEPAPPGTSGYDQQKPKPAAKLYPTTKGVENAKKRLRAFAIQKKTTIAPPVVAAKPVSTGNTTVLIGKVSSMKTTLKPEKVEDESKKPPKPPKPGANRKVFHESYTQLQKKTLSEIEDMKRKMELVDLGIPLGLICPGTNEKAMPTKAMPPIKSFLAHSAHVVAAVGARARLARKRRYKSAHNPSKINELIREAKKARAEGKEYKFDYQKLLPDYDNPFQRKKEDIIPERKDVIEKKDEYEDTRPRKSKGDRERRTSDRHDRKNKKNDKGKYDKTKEKDKNHKENYEKIKERRETQECIDKNDDKSSEHLSERDSKETDLNLNDYVVCDSWSLDNDEKNNSSSPQVEEKSQKVTVSTQNDTKNPPNEPIEQRKISFTFKKTADKSVDSPKVKLINTDSPKIRPIKIERLKPVIDSFKFEIDPNDDDEVLDIFDENTELEKYSKVPKENDSPIIKFDYERDICKDTTVDMNDDKFLESVINEIKQEAMSDDDSQDKGLVEYDSPTKDNDDGTSQDQSMGSITPELDDKLRVLQSNMRDYDDSPRSHDSGRKSTDSCKSVESGYKSTESGYNKSTESYKESCSSDNFHLTTEREERETVDSKISMSTMESLETWSFVLKICQPLLFRHDKNKCYKETRSAPKLWYTETPKLCSCVKDRAVVYEELEMCKMNLVDRVYSCAHVTDSPPPCERFWYPRLAESAPSPLPAGRDVDRRREPSTRPGKGQRWSMTPERSEVEVLDREYQRFMQAVAEPKANTSRSTTPVRQEVRKMKVVKERDENKKKEKKKNLSNEGWSQDSDLEEEVEKSKKPKGDKAKTRKRKRSASPPTSLSGSEDAGIKKKKVKKKANKIAKTKLMKRSRLDKKILQKLKEKQKNKKRKPEKIEESDLDEEMEKEIKKKEKLKKKKQQKVKKKAERKRKAKAKSSSSSDSSSSGESSSDSESEAERRTKKAKRKDEEAKRKKKKKEKKKKRKKSTSDSTQSEELFDMNVLNNIKTERLTDEEPHLNDKELRNHREIINMKELQEDFSSNVQVKQELEDAMRASAAADMVDRFQLDQVHQPQYTELEDKTEKLEFKEPQDLSQTQAIRPVTDESNLSQCSSQESVCSVKDAPAYEKDESHLRPSSQNSNYSFNDVLSASQGGLYHPKVAEDDKFEGYEHGNYEMYEQLAMAYQSDVASQQISPPSCSGEQRIETVVRARSRGEIKCDWRAGEGPSPLAVPQRPSRWGLKPGEVNIVLTGGGDASPERDPAHAHVYQIQSLAKRADNSASGYDEAYAAMYGAADRLQYGDCFSPAAAAAAAAVDAAGRRSLDARINQALRDTVLGDVANETSSAERDDRDRGILVTKSLGGRAGKRVSFADGYKPGQDSDTEGPPVKKKKKSHRTGCAWPCPATHPDHVPLWDALPPPPPPPGSPPPRLRPPPPLHLLRTPRHGQNSLLPTPPHMHHHKFDPSGAIPNFMPPEPPPGLLNFA